MKKSKRINKKRIYTNSEETLLVISRYVPGRFFDAQKALRKLSQKQQVLVLADHIGGKKKDIVHSNLIIHRLWRRNHPFSFIKLIPFVMKYDKIAHVLIQFDFKTFGRRIENNLIVPLILFYLKLSKKRIYFEFHQILNEKKIRKNTPLKYRIRRTIFNLSLKYFYQSVTRFTNNILVFKPSFKQSLSKFIPEEQIILLPSTLVKINRIKSSRQKDRKMEKTLHTYKRIVSTPYDITPNISFNLK